MRRLAVVALPVLLGCCVVAGVVACNGENAKDATAAVVGKGIEMGKGTVTGIAEGIAEGRRQGASADGAVVVANADELALHGGARVGEVVTKEGSTTISILVENTGGKPLRATQIAVIVLDKEGVVIPINVVSDELTVPPNAKSRLEVTTSLTADRVGTVRLYGKDLPR